MKRNCFTVMVVIISSLACLDSRMINFKEKKEQEDRVMNLIDSSLKVSNNSILNSIKKKQKEKQYRKERKAMGNVDKEAKANMVTLSRDYRTGNQIGFIRRINVMGPKGIVKNLYNGPNMVLSGKDKLGEEIQVKKPQQKRMLKKDYTNLINQDLNAKELRHQIQSEIMRSDRRLQQKQRKSLLYRQQIRNNKRRDRCWHDNRKITRN